MLPPRRRAAAVLYALCGVLGACSPAGLRLGGNRAPAPSWCPWGSRRWCADVGGGCFVLELRGGCTEGGLEEKIAEQASIVRAMKQAVATDSQAHSAEEVRAVVDKLKALKMQLNPPPGKACDAGRQGGLKGHGGGGHTGKAERKKGDTLEGITTSKADSFSAWYSEVVVKSELIDYYDVSGCYILRPWAYAIWELLQQELDRRIKAMDVQGCYFPMFVSEKALNAEQDHVVGFTPEVAWVTKTG